MNIDLRTPHPDELPSLEPDDRAVHRPSEADTLGPASSPGEEARQEIGQEMGEEPTPPGRGHPRWIGRLELRERIGSGAMGDVYAAYDVELDRMVAVKLVHAGATDTARCRRLQQEARALARVSHPHVVQVFDVGIHDGRVFVAMELIEGQTLTAWNRAERRRVSQVLRLLIEAGRGLEAAHTAGVIHRDFKPDNVMVDAAGRARVLDFGLARTVVGLRDRSSASTLGRGRGPLPVVGTPAYMAPEQIRGQPVDARSDVFSYCVSAWEMLFGQRPFEGETAMEIILSISQDRRRSIPRRTQVSARLRRILERGLRREPRSRWPQMGSLLGALEGELRWPGHVVLLATTPIVLSLMFVPWMLGDDAPPCPEVAAEIEEAWSPTRRRILEARAGRTPPQREGGLERALGRLDDYVESWAVARRELCVAAREAAAPDDARWSPRRMCLEEHRAAFEEIGSRLAELAPGSEATASLRLTDALPRIEDCERDHIRAPLDPHRREQGRRLAQLRTRIAMGSYQTARVELEALQPDVDASGGPSARAEVQLLLARIREEDGARDVAAAMFEAAFDLAVAADDPRVATEAATGVGRQRGAHPDRYAETLVWARVAESFASRLEPREPGRLAPRRLEAQLACRRGQMPECLAIHKEILAEDRKIYGELHPQVAQDLGQIAAVHFDQGRRDRAAELWTIAIERLQAASGPEHPTVGTWHFNLGVISLDRRRYAEARSQFERAVAIARAARGEHDPTVARPMARLGAVELRQGRWAEARARLDAAEAIVRRHEGDEGLELGTIFAFRAELVMAQGDLQEALELYRQGQRLIETVADAEHPRLARILEGRGRALLQLGRAEEAIEPLGRALVLRRDESRGTSLTGEVAWSLSEALVRSGQRVEARTMARRAREWLEPYPEARAVHEQVERWLLAEGDATGLAGPEGGIIGGTIGGTIGRTIGAGEAAHASAEGRGGRDRSELAASGGTVE